MNLFNINSYTKHRCFTQRCFCFYLNTTINNRKKITKMKKIIIGLVTACLMTLPILFYNAEIPSQITCITVIIPAFTLICFAAARTGKQYAQMQQYRTISTGMNKTQVFNIMGTNYNHSKLRNNREKYEWQIGGTRYKSNYYKIHRLCSFVTGVFGNAYIVSIGANHSSPYNRLIAKNQKNPKCQDCESMHFSLDVSDFFDIILRAIG